MQITDVDDSGGVINVRLAEMVVGNLNLRYVDRKTGEVREEGATRPEVILRQLATRPGQVTRRLRCHGSCQHLQRGLLSQPLCIFPLGWRLTSVCRAGGGSGQLRGPTEPNAAAGVQCAAGQDRH